MSSPSPQLPGGFFLCQILYYASYALKESQWANQLSSRRILILSIPPKKLISTWNLFKKDSKLCIYIYTKIYIVSIAQQVLFVCSSD